jgi:hypothetical protein
MSTETVPIDKRELEEAVARLTKRIRDPEQMRRAREDMNRMREETRRRIGIVEMAVDLTRNARDP